MKKNKWLKLMGVFIMLAIFIKIVAGSVITAYGNTDSMEEDYYSVPVTLYDYKSDSEIETPNGVIDNHYKGEGDELSGFNHYPFENFNKQVNNYFKENNMKYPIYFGDFYGNAPGSSNGWFHWAANRANTNDMTAAVQGLVDNELNFNGDITQNGAPLPYFNESFLNRTINNKSIGKSVDTNFTFRKTIENGVEYYEFDSKDGKDNAWLENGILNYSGDKDEHGVWDALHVMVSSTSKDGIGFFPFNNRATEGSNDSRSKLNFGFGLRMDIDFTLPKDGKVINDNGEYEDIKFEFSGDDDVWIFIDGVLVLDIGGMHKRSTGSINFNSEKLYSQVGKVINGSITGNTNQDVKDGDKVSLKDLGLNFDDPTEKHTLTMFYMERGMIESNLKIRYNFINTNILNVDKKVDTSTVNSALKDVVNEIVESESFKFNITKIENGEETSCKNNTYNLVGNGVDIITNTNEQGEFSLKSNESAIFTNQFDSNQILFISEEESSNYSTDITLMRQSDVVKKIDGNKTEPFNPVNHDLTEGINRVIFTNKVNTGNINISKKVTEYVENYFDNYENDKFTFQVKLRNIFTNTGEQDYKTYNLDYSINGEDKVSDNGLIEMSVGDTVIVKNIPVGTEYLIEEVNMPDKYKLESANGYSGVVNNEGTNADFTNGAKNEIYKIVLVKSIDEKYYPSDDNFTANDSYENLTNVEQSFLFTITRYDLPSDDPNRKVLDTFYEVISFNKGDELTKSRVLANLPKGYYEIKEDTSWSWKYDFKNVTVSPQGKSSCDKDNAMAIDIDLGYSIKTDPTVTFENNKKYSNRSHEDIPEGDSDIEVNTLKK